MHAYTDESRHDDAMERMQDQGIVITVRGHGEGGAVLTLLTQNHGRYAGYVHGGQSSSRMRALLQAGAGVEVEWSARTDEQLGAFTIQDGTAVPPAWMDDPACLSALQSACILIERTVPERENYAGLYAGTKALFDVLGMDRQIWGATYVFWEMALLREMGFGLNLSQCAVTGETDELHYVSPKSGNAVSESAAGEYKDRLLKLPAFLRGEGHADIDDIIAGLKLSAHFVEHRLFAHTTHTMPEARLRLAQYFEA